MSTAVSRVFVALDTTSVADAVDQARAMRGAVAGVKLGLEFFNANGPAGVRQVIAEGLPLFLDLKFHDLPNTVAGAVREGTPLGPSLLTVHARGGRARTRAGTAPAT